MRNELTSIQEIEREEERFLARQEARAAGNRAVQIAKAEGVFEPEQLKEVFEETSLEAYWESLQSNDVEHQDGTTAKPDFRAIALPLVQRGFRVTPVNPQTKMGCMKNWQKFQLTNPAEVEKYSKYFTQYNVGVVGKRGVGRHCFLDIDADGVVERIEAETGRKMPATYTVCSRPQSAPYKRHFYFTQTEYSFKKFGGWNAVNVNVRDLTRLELSKSGRRQHPTLYDVKGVGGGSLVVAAGSIRDTGEVYECIDDSPVADIPDWLVDWLLEDIRKYHVGKADSNARRFEAKSAVANLNSKQRSLICQNSSDTFDIAEEDIYEFLRWRASAYSGLGETGDRLVRSLTFQATQFCEGGEAFAKSDEGKRLIQKIAKEKRKVGNATWFYRQNPKIDINHLSAPPPSKLSVIKEIMADFPNEIPKHEALSRITVGLEKDGYPFDVRRDKDKLTNARKALGLVLSENGTSWKRVE